MAKTNSRHAQPHDDGLHYDKEALLAGYRSTFGILIKALFICVGLVLVYFFLFVVYLGMYGQNPAAPMVKEFGDRIQYEYKGTKLPMFGGPEHPEKKAE
jgi:hypothetical protein